MPYPAHLFSGAFTCDHAGAARNNATHRARPARRQHSQPATRPRPGARSLVRTRWAVPSGDARLRSPKGALRAPSSRTCSLDASVRIRRCAPEHFATPPRRHPPHPTALARHRRLHYRGKSRTASGLGLKCCVASLERPASD